MTVKKFGIDGGNRRVKFFDGEVANNFLHALALLKEGDWQAVIGKAGLPPRGVISVNGKHYAIGENARKYVIKEQPRGAARYTKEYYGALLCNAMVEGLVDDTEALSENGLDIILYAGHAPQDEQYAGTIEDICLGTWEVISYRGVLRFNIVEVRTFDEPLGGWNYFILDENGKFRNKEYWKGKKNDKRNILVLDVGGHTVDKLEANDGIIDPYSLKSTRTGIINLLRNFEKELRLKYRSEFQNAGDIDTQRIEQALITGKFPYGKEFLPCADIAERNITALVNDIIQIINEAGGAANFNIILLTGGGSVIIANILKEALPMMDFLFVEENLDDMQYANVVGAYRMQIMLDAMG